MRFEDFEYSAIPGPGLYQRKGFADEAVEKATKFNSVVNCPSMIISYKKKDLSVGIEEVEETNNENDG